MPIGIFGELVNFQSQFLEKRFLPNVCRGTTDPLILTKDENSSLMELARVLLLYRRVETDKIRA